MFIWSSLIDALRLLLFALSHVCGGSLGGAILVLSLTVRVALLPYTLRLALRMRAHQAALRALSPKLRKLEKKHAGDPLRLARETRALYAANGLSIVPPETWKGAVVPALVGAAVYRAVESVAQRAIGFLWISDLSRPDALLASVAAGLAGAATVAAGAATGPSRLSAALAAGITFLVAWRLSAATGLYWVASNAVGVVQSLLVRRRPTGA